MVETSLTDTWPLIALALLALLTGGLAAALFLRRQGDTSPDPRDAALATLAATLSEQNSALTGRLQQMSEEQKRAESALTKALTDRLDTVSHKMGASLTESAAKAAKSFGEIETRLKVIDDAQKNLEVLSGDIVGLQDILSNKQQRGHFGEIQLNDLVKSILPPSAYKFQVTLSNGKRADCMIDLPNPPGPIVIDAKFPLESYHGLQAARTEDQKKPARRAFANDIMTHVKAIADKYIVTGETAESALMFLPSEAVYAELHANFPEVVEKSFAARVWIVSPTTMMATLNTIRAVLKDVRMREQAHEIQKYVAYLKDDVRRLDERVTKLATHFTQAQGDIELITKSTNSITSRSAKIEELELGDAGGDGDDGGETVTPAGPRLVVD